MNIYKNFIFSVLLLSTGIAQAITLGFDSINQTGSSIDVGVVISELGSGTAPSISIYDFDINFDDSHLAFKKVAFGDPILGNQLDISNNGDNLEIVESNQAGLLNLYEQSFDEMVNLLDSQADSFILATVTFGVLKADTSQIQLAINELLDTNGKILITNLTEATVTTVPVLPSFWLMASGFGLLYIKRR